MKKRIISLILVVVMLALSLVGCGYSYADDDLSQYATFDKAAFDAALLLISIKDGDFTADEATRLLKVEDKVASNLAGLSDTDDKKTAGKPAAGDLFYYNYYITADATDKNGNAVTGLVFLTDRMASSKAEKAQLGLNFPTDLAKDILLAFADYEFTDATVYAPITSGTSENGQVAYISYTRTYTTTDAAGVESKVTEKVTNHRVLLSDTDPLLKNFVGKTVSSSNSFTISDNADYNGDYSSAKVEWIENAGVTVKDVAAEKYEASTTLTDTKGNSYDTAKFSNIVYHVYPSHFVDTVEFNATNVINLVYGKTLSLEEMKHLLFGHGDDVDVDAELAKLEVTEGDKKVSFEDFITALVTVQSDYADKDAALEEALKAKDEAETKKNTTAADLAAAEGALKAAEDIVAEAGDAATEEQKKAVSDAKSKKASADVAATSAQEAFTKAEETYNKAKTALDEATAKRDAKVSTLLALEGMEAKITEGYKTHSVYESLQTAYNTEILNSLAKEVYALIEKHVTVEGAPAEAVEDAVEQMIENYEYSFYNNEKVAEDSNHSSTETYYKKFGGSFKEFLIYAVNLEHKGEAKTYDDAVAKLNEVATGYVQEVVKVWTVAKAYEGVIVTDEEFDEYKDTHSDYTYNETLYGENTVLNAYQFDELMNYFLEREEVDGKVTYKKLTPTIA